MSILTNLISCWELNEASGTRNDAHGSNHLTDNNTVTSIAGKVGDQAIFVGTSAESLTRLAGATLQTGDITYSICGWLTTTTSPTFSQYCVAIDDSGDRQYAVGISDDGSSRFFFRTFPSTYQYASSFGAISSFVAYFFVASYNATTNTQSISINNGTVNSSSVGTRDAAAGTGTFSIGKRNFPSSEVYMTGAADQICFYKRDLFETPADITWLYNSGNGRSYADMVAAGDVSAALTGNLSNVAVQSLSSLEEFVVAGVDSSVSVNTAGTASEIAVTSNLSTITVDIVIGSSSVPSEGTATLSGVNCTASVGNVVGVTVLPVTVGEYRHVAAGPIAQRRPMRLKDLERIYKQMERKR